MVFFLQKMENMEGLSQKSQGRVGWNGHIVCSVWFVMSPLKGWASYQSYKWGPPHTNPRPNARSTSYIYRRMHIYICICIDLSIHVIYLCIDYIYMCIYHIISHMHIDPYQPGSQPCLRTSCTLTPKATSRSLPSTSAGAFVARIEWFCTPMAMQRIWGSACTLTSWRLGESLGGWLVPSGNLT